MDIKLKQARLQEILDRAKFEKEQLFLEVFAERQFPDGSRVKRVWLNEDGTVAETITGVIVGAGVFEYRNKSEEEFFPNVQYWIRIETPSDYRSHQECLEYGLELNKAQDFWEGDESWSLVESS